MDTDSTNEADRQLRPLLVFQDASTAQRIENALGDLVRPGVQRATSLTNAMDCDLDEIDVVVCWYSLLTGVETQKLRQVAARAPLVIALSDDHLAEAASILSLADGVLLVDRHLHVAKEILKLSCYGYSIVPRMIAPGMAIDQLRRDLLDTLTLSEHQVLKELGTGCSNREIAVRLNITESAVKALVRGLMLKLRLRNRTEAGVFAIRNRTELERKTGGQSYLV